MSNQKTGIVVAVCSVIALVAVILGVHQLASPAVSPAHVPPVKVGSALGDTIVSDHITVNGVTTWTLRQNMQAATTSLCSIPNPAGAATTTTSSGSPIPAVGNAESILTSFSAQITGGTTSSMTFDIATSTTPWATSSPAFVRGVSVAANATYADFFSMTGRGQATSSDTNLVSSLPARASIVGAANFVNLKSASSTSGSTYTGQCVATFRSLNAL